MQLLDDSVLNRLWTHFATGFVLVAGNLVNYGGSVDINLWTTQVPAPGAQYVTGTKPDGTPSYMSYDPTGETTRGLPQPRYGELKNFGYVPKPGEVRTWLLALFSVLAGGSMHAIPVM